MKAISIFIGNEILSGKIINSNLHTLANYLLNQGIELHRSITIKDETDSIIQSINEALENSDIVIISGGLGPTCDDITREAIASALGSNLIVKKELFDQIKKRYLKRNIAIPLNNQKQAMIPENCKPIKNQFGLAFGILWEQKNKLLFALPGVPIEFNEMLKNQVLPKIGKRYSLRPKKLSVFKTNNLPESSIMETLEPIIKKFNIPITELGFYPSLSGVEIHYSADNPHQGFIDFINHEFHEHIYTQTAQTIPELLKEKLISVQARLGLAESCTGGLVSKLITDIPGSSRFFKGGIIAYSNELKINLLKVNPDTLEKYGAVSSQTSREMLEGLLKLTQCEYGISVTGIAGPEGGTDTKPVGTVYFSYGTQKKQFTEKIIAGQNRDSIRQRAAYHVLFRLLKLIQ